MTYRVARLCTCLSPVRVSPLAGSLFSSLAQCLSCLFAFRCGLRALRLSPIPTLYRFCASRISSPVCGSSFHPLNQVHILGPDTMSGISSWGFTVALTFRSFSNSQDGWFGAEKSIHVRVFCCCRFKKNCILPYAFESPY